MQPRFKKKKKTPLNSSEIMFGKNYMTVYVWENLSTIV